MSKVILESSDIRLSQKEGEEGDPMHDAVCSAVIIGAIMMSLRPKDEDNNDTCRKAVAEFLNLLDILGYTVVRKEVI